jgi:hypothetical protein
MARGFHESVEARRSRAGEISFGTGKLDGSEFVTETAEFGEASGDLKLFGGRSGRKDSDLRAWAEGFRFARNRDGFGALDFVTSNAVPG